MASILFVETHSSDPKVTKAVDYFRVLSPAKWLKKNTNWDVTIDRDFCEKHTSNNLEHVANLTADKLSQYDLVYYSYMSNVLAFSVMQVLKDFTHVVDVDDYLLEFSEDNPFTARIKEDGEEINKILTIIENAPHVTTTTPFLKSEYETIREGKSVDILPNLIDFNLWDHQGRKEDGKIRIGYAGSASHSGDLQLIKGALLPILKKYPNVELELWNIKDSELQALPNVTFRNGVLDFYDYINIWNTLQWDIAIAPLLNTSFNRGKSNLKFLEAGAMGIPFIGSPSESYVSVVDDGVNGLLAGTNDEWIEKLELLINESDTRKRLGKMAKEFVFENFSLEKQGHLYKEYFEKLLA